VISIKHILSVPGFNMEIVLSWCRDCNFSFESTVDYCYFFSLVCYTSQCLMFHVGKKGCGWIF